MCVYIYMCMCVCVYIYVCVYVCVCVCVKACNVIVSGVCECAEVYFVI